MPSRFRGPRRSPAEQWDVRDAAPGVGEQDLVLHAAAWTRVDDAEEQERLATDVNVLGTRHAVELGAPVVYFSTDYVFDGTSRVPYVESAVPRPVSVYGRTKLEGEEELRSGWVVRSSWLFGWTGHNFVRTMLRLGAERDEVRVVADQVGCPTYVGHLAEATRLIVEPAVRHLPRRRGRRVLVGGAGRSDLRRGWARLPCRSDLDRGARPVGPEAGLLRPAQREAGHASPAALARRSSRVPRPASLIRLPSAVMRLLVTGGCGFIGSHFVKRLVAAGDEVVVLDKLTYAGNPRNLDGVDVEVIAGDIADAAAVARAAGGCEAVVNFAAETHVDRSILGAAEFIQTDVFGTYVLLEHAKETGTRLVHVSTDEVYGDVPPGISSAEEDRLCPSSPYAASKAGGDLQVLAHVRTFGVDAVITRGSNTYGPFQYPEKMIPLFVTNALDGRQLPLYGDGRQTRDWLHVRDHCAAIELVLRKGKTGEAYNLGGGRELENRDVAGRILSLTGADGSLLRHVDDRPGHDRRYSLDSSKLRALGWRPERDFETGLAETVAWYRERRDWWEPLKSGEYLDYYRRQYATRLGGQAG